jgi:hypothetical protein
LPPQAATRLRVRFADEVPKLSTQDGAFDLPWIETFAVKLELDVFDRIKLAGACELKGAFDRSGL